MPPKQTLNETAERILEHARELVQLRGYNGFSYRDLARRIGIKTASIHYYFPTKSDLGLALIERYREDFSTFLAAIDAEASDALDKLRRYVEIFARTFDTDQRICLCGSLAVDVLTLTDPVRSEVRRYLDDNVTWLTRVLEEGKASGLFRDDLEAGRTAETLLSTLEGAMLTARPFSDRTRLESAGNWILESIRAR